MKVNENEITRDMISFYKYPEMQGTRYGSTLDHPISSVITEWHIVFMLETHLNVYSKITKGLISSTSIGNGAAMLGLCTDNLIQRFWMHSNRKVYYVEYDQEGSNIWIDYLKMAKYKDALKICQDQKYKPLI